jgi:xanthine dehydrogenase accessory factor
MNKEVFAAVSAALERGEAAALVTIVATTGSTPQRVGAKMLVFADGRTVGTIGGGCYENDAFGKAREAIRLRKPQLVHYELDDDFAQETGLICGGQMDVYIEPIEPSPELYIVGAGHVGFHLARVAQEVGFNVHVVDDREKFANAERFPGAAEIVVDDISSWLTRAQLPAHAYAVIVTRGHTNDLEALRALARRELRYLGLIGSRAKVARIYEELSGTDLPADALTRVHAPIGLDIGAVSPPEIAVAIMAEITARLRQAAEKDAKAA